MDKKIKNVLITGGTRGLGLEYARHLAAKGYNVGITDISSNAGRVYNETSSIEELLEELSGNGGVPWFGAADLTDMAHVSAMLTAYLQKYGEIHGLVANAGGDIIGNDENAAGGKAENNTFMINDTDHDHIFRRNFDTCYNVLKAVVPIMKMQGFGKLITISSINAVFGVERETSYSIAKAGVIQLTRCLAKELRPDGINVNCVVPGPVKTGRFKATLKGRNAHDLESLHSEARLERVGMPSDISPVIEFLLSPAADFISGAILKVDGGLINQPM
jgi:NAD(P)-dependent dehydrogenase (short-subunit alcohol dehydrogenase family)